MASWIVHLRVAEFILKEIPQLDEETFYVGNLSPDCGIPTGEDNHFEPPQKVTHFLSGKGKASADPERFYREYAANCKEEYRSFLLGYYCHLHTDLLWSYLIAIPTKERFADELAADKKLFWKNVKKDWYGLDHDFLVENPEFRGYQIICSLQNVDQTPLDFYPDGAIMLQMNSIRHFYEENDFSSGRTGRYMTKAEMDDFVEKAAKDITKRLKNLP